LTNYPLKCYTSFDVGQLDKNKVIMLKENFDKIAQIITMKL